MSWVKAKGLRPCVAEPLGSCVVVRLGGQGEEIEPVLTISRSSSRAE
jgi:hypothetical protein